MKETEEDKLRRFNTYVWEGSWASAEWRKESWRDCEVYDGGDSAWSESDWADAVDAGIDPITVSRIFPAVNKLMGGQVINRYETIVKGRTKDDTEIAQVMTEGIKYVYDQYEGEFLITNAYADALIPGFGCLSPCFNDDPRKERVAIRYRDWRTVGWDPFSSPWWTPETTRYVYRNPWLDLEDFKDIFPNKKQEIQNAYDEYAGEWRERGMAALMDEAQQQEEKIRMLSANDWVDGGRKRIRPVELWYPVNETGLFSLFPDGRCFEITDKIPPQEAFEMIKQSQQVLKATVKKMRVATFFGESLLLQDVPTPYPHDQYPLVPFVGYIDRWGFPYGAPRHVRGQEEEVNKRRSMALAMLKKRRTTIEEDAVSPKGNPEMLAKAFEEANKLDGQVVLAAGGLSKFKIEDLAQLSQFQIELLRQSEFEIRDIMGSDSPMFAGEQAQSGVAKEQDRQKSAVTTASLSDNLRRSMAALGNQIICNIQSAWKYEKVLRVTDRLTGAERFVKVNEQLPGGGTRNNITQAKFDLVVSEAPVSSTVRERNMQILEEAIKKSPPEAVPTLLIASFEMSDLPNKEILIEKLKPILGVDQNEELSPEEAKQKALDTVKAQQEQMQFQTQLNMELMQVQLNEAKLKNLKLEAEIAKIKAETTKIGVDTQAEAISTEQQIENHEAQKEMGVIDGIERGIGLHQQLYGGKDGNRVS